MTALATCAKTPCKSYPYRRDVPSGVWAAHEYEKLPAYDGEIIDQLLNDATAMFYCHQADGHLCAGWVAAHGPWNLLAMRLHGDEVDPSVWDYATSVKVFATGQEACDHGKAEIDDPGVKAQRMMDRIARQRPDIVQEDY